MKNLNVFTGDCFDFHKQVVNSKRNTHKDPTYKQRLLHLSPAIQKQYQLFDSHFATNTLEKLAGLGYIGAVREDLHGLYSYNSKAMQDLRIALTTGPSNRVNNTCQNCTIGEVSSFDHLMPKNNFAEFVVNPKNLIPSCSKCNSLKTANWMKHGKRIFLNLYSDALPNKKYLFVHTTVHGDVLNLNYYLDNPEGIAPELYSLIESHYSTLGLQAFHR